MNFVKNANEYFLVHRVDVSENYDRYTELYKIKENITKGRLHEKALILHLTLNKQNQHHLCTPIPHDTPNKKKSNEMVNLKLSFNREKLIFAQIYTCHKHDNGLWCL